MKDTIVLYPCPGRGHLNSMVEFGRLILKHHPRFSIDIIIPAAPSKITSGTDDYIAAVSATTPSVTFHRLLPPKNGYSLNSSNDFVALVYELGELNNPQLQETLVTISSVSNLKAFVIDVFCNAAFRVSASRLGIPTYYYITNSASGLAAMLYLPTLHDITTKSFRELGDSPLNIPGLPPIPAKDMAENILDGVGKSYECLMDSGTQMAKSAGIIVNTFELLDERAVKALIEGQCTPGRMIPPLYCIGPVVGDHQKNRGDDRHECLSWLDSKQSRSVVFLCFGSMGLFSVKQYREMAIGLERSGVNFLWVIRDPAPDDKAENRSSADWFLSEGFLERTKDRGFVVKSWAPQVEVLSHDSVGGFVTHCGWNSLLEGVCAGLPMLAWPLYAEQKMNRAVIVEEMKLALAVTQSEEEKGLVSAAELEERVKELMKSEKGMAVRERVIAMKEAAAAAMRDGGSSRVALDQLAASFKII